MTTIVTRIGKGSALSWQEADDNFTNLNADKVETTDLVASNVANTPAGSIIATNVQLAINELDTEKLPANATALNGTTIPASKTLVVTTDISSTVMPWVAPGTNGNVLTSNGTIWTSVASPNKQIQSISASVAANAMIISASTLTLDFRSTTLGSGTVTTVSGTPANLVISSGSTLGTTSAIKSRIIVLAINNDGSIELAAVNISGGNSLDETGIISTTAEGGAGAADTANVIYSTTARSNLAYRIIGYIESTQTTAGTWATAPSMIQGQGGQALAAMSSLGYGQTWQTVTRTSGTTYYNTTGKPITLLIASVHVTGSISLTIGGVTLPSSWQSTTGGSLCYTSIVPTGAAYVITATSDTYTTYELR